MPLPRLLRSLYLFIKPRFCVALLLLATSLPVRARNLALPPHLKSADSLLPDAMATLAKALLQQYDLPDRIELLDNRFRLHIAAKDAAAALADLDSLLLLQKVEKGELAASLNFEFRTYLRARVGMEATPSKPFGGILRDTIASLYGKLPPNRQPYASSYFSDDTMVLHGKPDALLAKLSGKDSVSAQEALSVLRAYVAWRVLREIQPAAKAFFAAEDALHYIIKDSLLIRMKDGAQLSAVVVLPRASAVPLPAVLVYNIYSGPRDICDAKLAAAKGFAGVVVNTRGKHLSPQEVVPYEHDGADAYEVINWISKQSWCNGKVGMYGGSYLGFAQWSAVKKVHPALKTIVPQVAVGIGIDFPMRNGSFGTYGPRWLHCVGNNKETDEADFSDQARWDLLCRKWYESGRPFRALDTLDGRPNALFQRWLQHPEYDSYWQAMVPYGVEFKAINIPILTITGYYDDDQRGAFYYLMEHLKWNPSARHYLLIGPYDHFGGQGAITRTPYDDTIDAVAHINITDIVFQWFNHVLKGAPLPPLLRDRVNYEVAGANSWRSAPSPDAVTDSVMTFYFGNTPVGDRRYPLLGIRPVVKGAIIQKLDYKVRNDDTLRILTFVSEPLEHDVVMAGSFDGVLRLTINKKDLDLYANLFEVYADSSYSWLSTFYGRASHLRDRSHRRLLQPGVATRVPLNDCTFTAKKLRKGSRIMLEIMMPVAYYRQINYGTGKDVSDETPADGKEPIQIEWSNASYIRVPVQRLKP